MSIAASIESPVTLNATTTSRKSLWVSRVIGGVAVLFLTMDALMKLLQMPVAVQGSAKIGFNAHTVFILGVIQTVALVLYLVPRTAVLGAILWTGYLGGAVATHVRLADPLFSHILFPTYVGAMLWAALWLRDQRVRALVPFRR
jgi:hypothetical protein